MTTSEVLQLTLETENEPNVRMRLLRERDGQWNQPWTATFLPSELGLPLRLDDQPLDDDRFSLPRVVRTALPRCLESASESVWLQLREPFGYLGLVPWERLLADVVGASIVRLPSIDLAQHTASDDLQVAVLALAPDRHRPGQVRERLQKVRLEADSLVRTALRGRSDEASWNGSGSRAGWWQESPHLSARHVNDVVTAILEGSRRRTTVHVLTTPWLYLDLAAHWRDRSWPVHLHDPRTLPVTAADAGPVQGWLHRMTAAMGGEQADVVHIICYATVVGTKVRLALPDLLEGGEPGTSRFVPMPVLRGFLDCVGAWSLHLTSPPGNPGRPLLRLAACQVAERRPGPVVFTDLAATTGVSDIRSAYRFISGPSPAPPPRMPDAVLACEPYRVVGADQVAGGPHTAVAAEATRPGPEISAVIHGDDTPAWVAAAQRFIEQRQLELARLRRDAPIGTSAAQGHHSAAGVEEAVSALADVVARYASSTHDAGKDGGAS